MQKFRVRLETTVYYDVDVVAKSHGAAGDQALIEMEDGGGIEVDSSEYTVSEVFDA